MWKYGRSNGLTENETFKTVNFHLSIERVPKLKAMVALAEPPRLLQRRMSVDCENAVRPNVIKQHRNSIANISTAPGSAPLDRAQILHQLGMGRLLYLHGSDEEVNIQLILKWNLSR